VVVQAAIIALEARMLAWVVTTMAQVDRVVAVTGLVDRAVTATGLVDKVDRALAWVVTVACLVVAVAMTKAAAWAKVEATTKAMAWVVVALTTTTLGLAQVVEDLDMATRAVVTPTKFNDSAHTGSVLGSV